MKPALIIAGLGNPGAQHERTRHNAGFWAVDALSEAFGEGKWEEKQKFHALVQEARIVTVPILLVKPQTYMNLSGNSVGKLIEFYKLNPAFQLLVICDDIDLPLGELRFRRSGGPGTHNGLKSLHDIFGEGFARLRIGLGAHPAGEDLAAWVLSIPPEADRAAITAALQGLPAIIRSIVMDEGQAAPQA